MSEGPNAQQIEFWNGQAGERWAKLQERMDTNMRAITEAVIPFAAPKHGEHVLDVGCGCGTTTLLLARSVQPGGKASGVDISAPMLAVARRRAAAQNIDVDFLEADASTHKFVDAFDLVFSRFGIMFFDAPGSAFANIRRALSPGGRLVFVCWRPLAENFWASVPYQAAKHLLPPQEPVDPYAPGPFAFAEKQRITDVLGEAGFRDVRIEPFDGLMNVGSTLEDASSLMLDVGPLARAARELGDATRAEIREAVAEAFAPHKTPSGIAPPAACWFVRAETH